MAADVAGREACRALEACSPARASAGITAKARTDFNEPTDVVGCNWLPIADIAVLRLLANARWAPYTASYRPRVCFTTSTVYILAHASGR